MQKMFLYNISPIEQFKLLPFLLPYIGEIPTPFYLLDFFYFSITNLVIFLCLGYTFLSLFIKALTKNNKGFLIIPTAWQLILEELIIAVSNIMNDNIKSKLAQKYLPFVFTIYIFLFLNNYSGLIPGTFAATGQLSVTLTLSLCLFIFINIICWKKHKLHIFSLFLPQGTSTVLAFLLVPIEFISYIFKPISLAIRLFANMMAGHTLLKVIAGFSFTLMKAGFYSLHIIPIIILIPLFYLEVAVAFIQTSVFTILICIYLNDAINLH